MKKKLLIIIPVLLLGGGYVAKAKLMPAKTAKAKLAGEIYILPKQFTLNMADGRYATLTVALVLDAKEILPATAEGGATPPDGYGNLPEEAVIRSIITNLITNDTSNQVVSDSGRASLEAQILSKIKTTTDVKVNQVFFTDVAVQ